MTFKYVNGGSGRPPFKELVDYLDKQIVIAGTGGSLTMLAEPGSGTLAGNAHWAAFEQIARKDAALLSQVMQRDLDALVLAEYFPGEPVEAYFELGVAEPVAADDIEPRADAE